MNPDPASLAYKVPLDSTSAINSEQCFTHPSGIVPLLENSWVTNEEQSNPDLQEYSVASHSLRVSSSFDALHIITVPSSSSRPSYNSYLPQL